MDRRRFLAGGTAFGALGLTGAVKLGLPAGGVEASSAENGAIPVAFAVSNGATVIDFAGPWEVFQDVMLGDPNDMSTHRRGFSLSMVGVTREPVRASGGMHVVPTHTVHDAPTPRVLVVGAQSGPPALVDWIVSVYGKADLVMSVCTGAFILARAGLLDGLTATTHHDSHDKFEREFPRVHLVREGRYIDHGRVATAGGLTSGIDLALHVVDRMYGRGQALRTATYMEYESRHWIDGDPTA